MTLAHPLHAEVLRRALPRTRARRLMLEQAELIEQRGARRREDPLLRGDLAPRRPRPRRRRPCWSTPPGSPATPRTSPPSSGWPVGPGRTSRRPRRPLLLGEALYELGQFDESEEVLAAGQVHPDGSAHRAADGHDPQQEPLLGSARSRSGPWRCWTMPARGCPPWRRPTSWWPRRPRSTRSATGRCRRWPASTRSEGEDDVRTRVVRALILAPALTAVGPLRRGRVRRRAGLRRAPGAGRPAGHRPSRLAHRGPGLRPHRRRAAGRGRAAGPGRLRHHRRRPLAHRPDLVHPQPRAHRDAAGSLGHRHALVPRGHGAGPGRRTSGGRCAWPWPAWPWPGPCRASWSRPAPTSPRWTPWRRSTSSTPNRSWPGPGCRPSPASWRPPGPRCWRRPMPPP